jgi:hypothetical protein
MTGRSRYMVVTEMRCRVQKMARPCVGTRVEEFVGPFAFTRSHGSNSRTSAFLNSRDGTVGKDQFIRFTGAEIFNNRA